MDLSIAFGLLAAFSFGASDFFAKFAADRIGYLRSALYSQTISVLILLPFAVRDAPRAYENPVQTLMACGLGLVALVALLLFYRGLEIGPVAVVSPLTSSYPAISTVLAVFLLKETLPLSEALAIATTLAGIVLVTWNHIDSGVTSVGYFSRGTAYGLGAFVAFGFLYFGLKLVVGSLGVWLSIIMFRWVSAVVIASGFALSRRKFGFGWNTVRFVVLIALLDTIGNVAYNSGLLIGHVSLLSTLSALFSVVTIVLAWLFIKARLTRIQGVGLSVILVGVALLAYLG